MRKEKAIFVAEPLAGEAGNLRLLLEQMGYLVRMAGTTPETLEIMRREVFIQAVVAAELTLGDELTLAQVSRLPALQRLVAVGPVDEKTEIRARRAGADVYLARPVRAGPLAMALHMPLRGSVVARAP